MTPYFREQLGCEGATALATPAQAQQAGEPVAWAKEYATIAAFYGEQRAKRSGFRLMRHIEDGLHILNAIGASDLAKAAYCLHPIVQNDEAVDVTWSPAYTLACEYRDKANAYLCRPENDWVVSASDVSKVVGDMSDDCRAMLIADKRQNYADFIIAHYGTHARWHQLDAYFRLWISFLEGYTASSAQAQQAAGVPDVSMLVEALHKIKHKAVSLADAQVIALEALAAPTAAAQADHDFAAMTARGAIAWAGVDAQELRAGGAAPAQSEDVRMLDWAEDHLISCQDSTEVDSPKRWNVEHSGGTHYGFTLLRAIRAAMSAQAAQGVQP